MTVPRALGRVLDLPRADAGRSLPPRTTALASVVFDYPGVPGRPTRLLPIQTSVLAALEGAPYGAGVWAEVGAGHGKTLPSILAGGVVDSRRHVLIVQSSLVGRTRAAVEHLRAAFPDGAVAETITVLSRDTLSQTDAGALLYDLAPDLIVVDEAHAFMGASARTRRLEGYVSDYPDTRVVYLSGTMGGRALASVAPALHLCLRDGTPAPLPHERNVLDLWASVLDPKAVPSAEAKRYFEPLVRWAGVSDAVAAWKVRRTSAPGVVATSENPVTAALVLTRWRGPTAPTPAVTDALRTLESDWTLPDGTELVDAVRVAAARATLGLGFYYRTVYRPVAGTDPTAVGAWKEARATWARELRVQVLYRARLGLDSPALVVRALEGDARGLPRALRDAWAAWRAVADTVAVDDGEAVWLWDGAVDDAVAWANAQGRAAVWYSSLAVGAALRARGLPVYGAGDPTPPASVPTPALSILSHGTGHDLQAYDRALVLEPPTGAVKWEQLLARHHRTGQTSAEVVYHLNHTLYPQRARVAAGLKAAEHESKITLQPQRLLFGEWR